MVYSADQFINKRFNRLLILSVSRENNRSFCICKCDCGIEKKIALDKVKSGHTQSCGCYHKSVVQTHNLSKTKAYHTWRHIKERCKPDFKESHLYFDKGISVCEEWEKSFQKFYEDMGEPPTANHSIDRIDGNKGYYKQNCRWATEVEQKRNTNRNRFITIGEQTKCIAEWAEDYKLGRNIINGRLSSGWTEVDAVTTPAGKYQRLKKSA